MARTKNIRNSIINQFMDGIKRNHITSPLPSQSVLADTFNVSRTTIRHTLDYLCSLGVLEKVDSSFVILRKTLQDEPLKCDLNHVSFEEQSVVFEHGFFELINRKTLKPGDAFSEIELAKITNVSPIIVREYLLKFSRYNLTTSQKRGIWSLIKIDTEYANKLFEFRQLIENHALSKFINLPNHHPSWIIVRDLIDKHRNLMNTIGSHYQSFSKLDSEFHKTILSAANNRFFEDSFEVISMVSHFHYQWDESDLKQRNIIAIEEHLQILTSLLCKNDTDASLHLIKHLDTAKSSMIRSINATLV